MEPIDPGTGCSPRACTSGCATTTGVVGAVGVASKVRDVTALATRLVPWCGPRLRSGRPVVVPRSDAEGAEDAAAGAVGEVTSITGAVAERGAPDEAPPESETHARGAPPDPADVARAVGAGTLLSGTGASC